MNIVIIDYGMGNVLSIQNMIKTIGFDSTISSNPKLISSAHKLILPGVGAFDAAASEIRKREGLLDAIYEATINRKVPTLGICLGLQLLFESSEEGPGQGLGLIPGKVKKFEASLNLRVPHMGWNSTKIVKDSELISRKEEIPKFYFVHSYYVVPDNSEHITGLTNYGVDFCSMVNSSNIFGVQFHPEKSHAHGKTMLKSFVNIKC
jgi:glutamine amidotransferase